MINTLFNDNPITLYSTIDIPLSFPQKAKTIETDNSPYPTVSPEEKNNKTKSIRVELTMDEYNRFSQMAKKKTSLYGTWPGQKCWISLWGFGNIRIIKSKS